MSPSGERNDARTQALALVEALAPALADVATPEALGVARAAARRAGLGGLDRLLAACQEHAGRPWPGGLLPALERVRRVAVRSAELGDPAVFRDADRELAGLAGLLESMRWSGPRPQAGEGAAAVPTLGLAEALGDVAVTGGGQRAALAGVRLTPPVAAALRAALDWLVAGSGRPLAIHAADSVLEILCERVAPEGLAPATEVLAAIEANLGPAPGGPAGSWLVRVPAYAAREGHLMLFQGGVALAIPWHAVLRLRMAAADDVAERRSIGGWPVLAPLLPPAREAQGEVPLALVAHGRKRAWLVADRLVWKLAAEPTVAVEVPPVEGLTRVVRTEEGERYWVAEPGWLLRAVETPPLASGGERAAATPAAPAPAQVAPRSAPRQSVATPQAPAAPQLTLLTSRDVEALAGPPVPAVQPPPPASHEPLETPALPELPAPATPVSPAAPVPPAPAPPPARPVAATIPAAVTPAPAAAAPVTPRTALVAEDSFTARRFLTRELEQRGFTVHGVESAHALRAELERGAWSLVCVDVELPDARGPAFLAELAVRHGARSTLVALVRDAEDRATARRAGLSRTLRKPFDALEIDQLVDRLGRDRTEGR